jgi:GntR family transcriptional regulator/MocR family aminotransferase
VAIEWTGDGPGLVLPLDRRCGIPLGDQLQGALRDAIRDGRLRPGERLPSTRRMAADLHVSRGLVVAVYEQLIAGGYLVSQPGGSTRVAPAAVEAESTAAAAIAGEPRRPTIDFALGRPDLGSFPRREWLRALGAALADAPAAANGYVDPQGAGDRCRVADQGGRPRPGPDRGRS